MRRETMFRTAFMAFVFAVIASLSSCKLDLPEETQTSFETMTVKTSDIEVPMKFSARISDGQQAGKGSVLFDIDQRNEKDAVSAIIALYFAPGRCNPIDKTMNLI